MSLPDFTQASISGRFGVVDPQPRGVLGADDELVVARLRGQDRAFPADRELIGLDLLGVGARLAEVELDLGIDPLDDAVARRGTAAT